MFNRMAVLGVGAIGSIIGAYLTRAGHDVTLIDQWPEHVDTMKKKGLRVTALNEDFTVPVKAMHLAEVCTVKEPFDAVFLAVKSYDTEWCVHFIMPYLKPTGVIISAQNSINDEWIAPIVGYTRDIGCVITLGAGLYEPGHVMRTSAVDRPAFALGELNGMPTRRAKTLAEVMSPIGPTRVTTNLWGERWAKLAINCMANPVAGLTGLGGAALRQTSGTVEVSIKIASEVVKVGKALGVQVEPISGIAAEMYERADDGATMEELKMSLAENTRNVGEGKPSLLQDVLKGRRTEIDYLNGYVVARGKQVGVPTPVCEAITKLIRRIEKGELKPDVSNIKHLQPYL